MWFCFLYDFCQFAPATFFDIMIGKWAGNGAFGKCILMHNDNHSQMMHWLKELLTENIDYMTILVCLVLCVFHRSFPNTKKNPGFET